MESKDIHFSVIIPTKGRPELYATLLSVLRAGFLDGDEVIVVGDGDQPEARRIVECFKGRLRISYMETPVTRSSGGHQRMLGMSVANGTHLVFIDDDDVYRDGSFQVIRKAASENPNKIPIFKMKAMAKHLSYDILWREPKLYLGNVGTPMFCVPNVKSRLGAWSISICNDFEFIKSTVEKYSEKEDALVWMDHVIAEIW